MPLSILGYLFPNTIEQLRHTRDKHHIKIYNEIGIAQLGMYKVQTKHKNNQLICKLFVVPGNLMGKPNTKMLNMLSISYSTTGTPQRYREINEEQVEQNAIQMLFQLILIIILALQIAPCPILTEKLT